MIPKSTYDTETLAFFSSLSAAKRPLSIFSSVCAVHLEAQLSPQGLHRTPITHFTIYSNIYSNFGYISSLWCWLKVNLHISQYLHLFFDMTVIHPSAWINSRLPVLCFQFFFLQLFDETALKPGLEILSWDFLPQAVKIIFIIWIINTLIYLSTEILWAIHSHRIMFLKSDEMRKSCLISSRFITEYLVFTDSDRKYSILKAGPGKGWGMSGVWLF